MIIKKNFTLRGFSDRPFLVDSRYHQDSKECDVLIFIHGFKGFKDWGHWNLIADKFTSQNIAFIKFNFSHNGTTVDFPQEFKDIEAFGQNNFSKELCDLRVVIDHLFEGELLDGCPVNLDRIFLVGHSRGGPIAYIQKARDNRIKSAISWASVHTLEYAWNNPIFLEDWKQKGVYFVKNTRTLQEFPLYFQLYEDFMVHRDDYDTKEILKGMDESCLIVHGTADSAIPVKAAEVLHSWNSKSQLSLIQGADHVFGGRHPYIEKELPKHSLELVEITSSYIRTFK